MSTSLDEVVAAMQRIAPLNLAEEWDNVGLLAAPTQPRRISRALLTIDLTEPVLDEALKAGCEAIIAYHPPIFDKLSRLTPNTPKTRILTTAIEKRIAIYSPHTALDAAPGGVNDWLAEGFDAADTQPITPHVDQPDGQQIKVVVFTPHDLVDKLRRSLAQAGAGEIGNYSECSFNTPGVGTFHGGASSQPAIGKAGRVEYVDEIRVEMVAPRSALPAIALAIDQNHPYEEPAWEVYPLEPHPTPATGSGRLVTLRRSTPLGTVVDQIKAHLGLELVRLAAPKPRKAIKTIALCAGAGHSVISQTRADLYLTGEMRHHDVLDAVAHNTAVVLAEHTNTERPYLAVLKKKLLKETGRSIQVRIARQDRDPLTVI